MKRVVALVALAILSQAAMGQLLNESFTDTIFPPPGWVSYNKDAGQFTIQRLTTHYNTPPACAYGRAETDRRTSDWLCTPPVYAQNADTMFRWAYRGQSLGHRESVSVWISTTTNALDSFKYFVQGKGINSNSYLADSVSLGAYKGQRVLIGFEYCSDTSELNIYIDDISGPPLNYKDVGVVGIVVPPDSGSAGQLYYPSVYVHNFADSTQSGFPVYVVIRDSTSGDTVFQDWTTSGAVTPGDTITVTFLNAWTAAMGVYWVESFTALVGDIHPNNDTFIKKTKITIGAPTVTVVVPNGGEVWQVGSSHTISWTHGGGTPAGDSVWYRISPTDPWRFITAVGTGITSYIWNPVPNTPSESCLLRVKAFNVAGSYEDSSDSLWTIAYDDVGATLILAPVGTYDSGTVVTPQVRVHNYGSRTETFPVTLRIGTVYEEIVTGVTLGSGLDTAVDFPDWIAEPEGTYGTIAWTDLSNDQLRSNDTTRGEDSVHVIPPPHHDVGTTMILEPLGTLDSGTVVTPTAVVHNYGTRAETFPVTFQIGGGTLYNQTVSGVVLAIGQTDTVYFPNWTVEPVGIHDELCYTDLTGDINRNNDTAYARLNVEYPERHDVGATMIIAPSGTIDSGSVITPQVVVHNFGTRTETFPLTLRIDDTLYDQTISGITLVMGQTDTIDFPFWIAEPIGGHFGIAFTLLSGDEHPENDTTGREFNVQYPERHDVGATMILEPVGTLDSGTVVTPTAVVHNFGTRTETFPVTFQIGGGTLYDQTVSGIVLTMGQTDTVFFPNWTVEPVGIHDELCYTDLTGDIDRTNDTAYARLNVEYPERHDVGATMILAPFGSIDSGTVVTPQVVVHNFGTRTETFPVTLELDGGTTYDQTVSGVVLVMGQTDTVDFPTWVAEPIGGHSGIAFTLLNGDQHPENDTTGTEFYVQYPERHDVGTTMILVPTGTLDSGTVVTPTAVVYNYGTRTETFPVTFQIGGGTLYNQTVTGVTLLMGETDTIAFPNWTVEPVGIHDELCYTDLTGDINRSNDTAYARLLVLYPERHDVGATTILAPVGTIDSGTVVTPTAVIRNFGTRTETFPVTFNIGTAYSQTIQATLVMGQIDTVSFPNWTTQLGSYNEVCFTDLTNDRNRLNDTARASLTVILPPRHDVGATAILAPLGTLDSGTVVTPTAIIRNFGTRTETFPVTFNIGTAYSQTMSATLAVGQIDTIMFPNWITQLGSYNEVCFTNLTADLNRRNDTAYASLTIIYPPRHDVGATAILAPLGTIDSGTAVTPTAVIHNFGTRTETFPVVFNIGSAYSQTIQATLTMGQTDTVYFPNWTTQLGSYSEVCFTNLTADLNRRNDTAYASLTVIYPPRHDVGATAILAPLGTLDSGTVTTPTAVIHNFGTRTETFPVTFNIGTVYSQVVQATLAMGETDTIAFPNWTVEPVGVHAELCFTNLTGDEHRNNDTARAQITVLYPERHDVGTTLILAPLGTLDSGTVTTPTAVIHNFGTRTETFPVTFDIGSVYSQTVQATLAMGETDTISFANWTAEPVGRYPLVCFTNLANDRNRSNDTAYGMGRIDTLEVVYPERHDVGATMILAPLGQIDSGTVATPTAVIHNFGTRTETFPVTFNIGTVYSQVVQATLVMGETDTISFPTWVAEPVGRYPLVCFTNLTNDRNRSNDTTYGLNRIDTLEVLYPERHDVGATMILAPLGTLDSGTVTTPTAVIHNFGTRTETFPVTFNIGAVYSQMVQATLVMGETDTIIFPNWIAEPVGRYPLVCFTDLTNDRNRLNDTTYGLGRIDTLEVVYPERHDVGVSVIIVPTGSVDFGTILAPQATVQNYGTRTDNFPVTMLINGDYTESIDLTLTPGESRTVTFTDWTASPLGAQAVMCYTGLVNDRNPANDTARTTVTVLSIADVGTEAIVSPVGTERLREGFVSLRVVPQARIKNYGQRAENNFEVHFWIDSVDATGEVPVSLGSVFDTTVTITTAIAPGGTQELTFPELTLTFGDYTPMVYSTSFMVRCSTRLTDDRVVANDKKETLYTVVSDIAADKDGKLGVIIYNRAGERIKGFKQREIRRGDPLQVVWDGTNDRGVQVAHGTYMYLLRFDATDGTVLQQVTKIVVANGAAPTWGYVLTWRKP